MKYFYEISYNVYNNKVIYKKGTFGLMHSKQCYNTLIKTFIKKMLPSEERTLEIEIIKNELISEEESIRRFGNNIMDVRFKHVRMR